MNRDEKTSQAELQSYKRFVDVVRTLRSPQGCAWDRKQTPDSLKENLIEEAYECFEAIIDDDAPHVKEELGDILLLVTMVAAIYEENQAFTLQNVLETISDKLIRRHPHVFGESEASHPDEIKKQWDEIKVNVEGRDKKNSLMDEIPKHAPPLERAYEMQKKCAKKGFDWEHKEDVLLKVEEEIAEFRQDRKEPARAEEELGDLLFSVINLARVWGIDPQTALFKTNKKFDYRFRYIERELKRRGRSLEESSLEEMDRYWNQAKKES